MKHTTLFTILLSLTLFLTTIGGARALTWDSTIAVQPNNVNISFNTNIWGTNFDNGFSQRGDTAYCKGRDLFNESTGITKRNDLGQTYARVFFTRQANNTISNASSSKNWTFADKIISDVIANNVTPIIVLCGYATSDCIRTFGNE